MRERPILFSAPMVRAILEGRKTQTRRAVKFPRKREAFVIAEEDNGTLWPYQSDDGESMVCDDGCEHPYSSPYGRAGDHLWVRESGWERPERTGRMMRSGADTWAPYYYDADGIDEYEGDQLLAFGFKRRPSIFMPRWASRITLEITGVRVERLQDVTAADAISEGVERTVIGEGWRRYHADQEQELAGLTLCADPVSSYRSLWESINGPDAWAANPFVWVVEFKRHV